jgi:hypothetical protein
MSRFSWVWTLFNDVSTTKKLEVMSKWDAMCDDERSYDPTEGVEIFLKVGKTYRITVEEI